MIIRHIRYTGTFHKQLSGLPLAIQEKAIKCEQLFRNNPLHPSLRTHKLSGKLNGVWSISIDRKHRIIFECFPNGDIVFYSIGNHSIYDDHL